MYLHSNRKPCLLRSSLRVLLLTVVGAPSVCWSMDAGYSLGYGLGYTDNALLTPNNTQDDWINSVKAGFTLLQSTPTVDARIASDVQYNNYKNNTSSDNTVFDLNLFGKWNISPQRFSWTLEDYFSQTAINPTGPNIPDNRQNTNTVSSGPDFTLRINPVNALELGARYMRNTYQTSNIANTRTTGYTRWMHDSSPRTRFSLNVNAESVNYDDLAGGTNVNFTRTDQFVGLSNSTALNRVTMDVGTTHINRDNASDVSGGLGRFRWTRQISSTSSFALYASSELSDAGQQALSQGQAASLGPLQPSSAIPIVSGDVFRKKNAELAYAFQRVYGHNIFRVFRQKNEFEFTPAADEDRRGGSFDVGYDFSAATTATIFGSYARVESFVTSPSLIYRDQTYGVGLLQRLTRLVSLRLDLVENLRDADPGTGINYTEHRALLSITYSDIRRVAPNRQ